MSSCIHISLHVGMQYVVFRTEENDWREYSLFSFILFPDSVSFFLSMLIVLISNSLSKFCTLLAEASILGGGGGGAVAPNENIGGGGQTSFCPPPPNNFDNFKNS